MNIWSRKNELEEELKKVVSSGEINPINAANVLANDVVSSPPLAQIGTVEFAHFYGSPAYIFGVHDVDASALRLINYLNEYRDSELVSRKPLHDDMLVRPFPIEHTGAVYVYEFLSDWESMKGWDPANAVDLNQLKQLATELSEEVFNPSPPISHKLGRVDFSGYFGIPRTMTDDEFAEIQAYEEFKAEEMRGLKSA